MSRKGKNTAGILAGLLAGAAAGVILGMLYAPEEGKETRKKIKTTKILTLGNILIDSKNFTVTINNESIRLTKTEFAILEYFAKNTDTVIKRESLMRDIIGYDNYVYDRTIDTHVKNLRKKLGDSMQIETIRGIGYRIG